MKGTAVTTYLCLYLVLGQKITYNGNQLWKIPNTNQTLKLLRTLEAENCLTLWSHNSTKIDAMIHSGSIDEVKERLQKYDLKYHVSIEDLQKVIDEENQKPPEDLGRKGYRLTWDYYHDLGDIYDYLHYLEATFPKLCTICTIGYSAEGRPIKLLKVSDRKPNKAVFIEGGIHAREWISPAAVTYIIRQIVATYDGQIDWYFVPVLNPDGYVYSYHVERLWRKNRSRSRNCIGVDLNRNFGFGWGKNGSSDDPCSNSYRGKRPFSELETAAVANFFNNDPDIKWAGYISIHSYGQYIVYPWGLADAVLEDKEDLNKVAVEAAKGIVASGGVNYTVGPVASTIYPVSGSSLDWAKGIIGTKYTFTIELRDTGHGFIHATNLIKVASKEALILVKTVAKNVKIL